MPLILKLNNSDSLAKLEPCSALTGTVEDALRLGCVGIGYTIYPGSGARNQMYQDLRDLTLQAKARWPGVVVELPARRRPVEDGETSLDIIAYAAHIAAELGAPSSRSKLPKDPHRAGQKRPKVYAAHKPASESWSTASATSCRRRSAASASSSSRAASQDDASLLEEIRAIHHGGGHGFDHLAALLPAAFASGVKLLRDIMDVYAGPQ